jgi:hypothetical protein
VTPLNDDTAVLPAVAAEPEPDEPRADGLAEELAKAAPKRWWNKATVVLGALVLLLGGFLGGLQAQKHWGTTATASNRAAAFGDGQSRTGNAFPGGTGTGTGQRGASTAASGTAGTVKLVDGSTIYLQVPGGDIVTVKTDGKTAISTARTGKLSDVKAGQSVTVTGTTGSDGTVTATSVAAQQK